jgi:hypothetical protein
MYLAEGRENEQDSELSRSLKPGGISGLGEIMVRSEEVLLLRHVFKVCTQPEMSEFERLY